MKRLKNLPESEFLKIFFAFYSAFFLIAAFFMPDRANMIPGLWQILSQPSKLSTSYFALGGYAATFLNMGLVGVICTLLFVLFKGKASNASTLAVILTVGFGVWGINILNMWPSIFGVWIYGLVKREKFGSLCNAMLFSTGLAPLITDLMIRYPHTEVIGFNLAGIGLSLLVGFTIGFFLPAGLANSPKVHKGFDLYSAAFPMGMMAFFLNAVLFKTLGVELPAGAPASQLEVVSPLIVNVFCCVLFGVSILLAFLMGCRPKQYLHLLKDPELVTNFTSTYGNEVFLMNFGIFGLFILGYYNVIGASFNGVTFGIIFCMLSTCNSGSHPANVLPIMIGYALAALVSGWLSKLAGGDFTFVLNAQAICVGLCYANGLSPIADKYGWRYGLLAAVMHYLLVTSVPNLHGGYCLYNGGFTAALICIILIPELERFTLPKDERRAKRALKTK